VPYKLKGQCYIAVRAVESHSELEGRRYTVVCAIESHRELEGPRYAAVCAVEPAVMGSDGAYWAIPL
jgi:hypothetical protein